MKSASLLQSVVILCLMLACSPAVLAQNSSKKNASLDDLPDFSATEIRGSIKWKIYHSSSMFRVEPSSAMATVFVPKKDKVYNLLIFPKKTNCVVMKTAQAKMMRSPLELVYGSSKSAFTRTDSHEVVDGHPCTVLEAVTTSADGSDFKSKIWVADDLKGVPLRIDVYAETGVVTSNFHDIAVGAVEPSLFKMPANCIPPEKTYQVAPKNSDPGKPPAGQKAPESKPQ